MAFGVFLFTENEVTLVPNFCTTDAEKREALRNYSFSAITDTDSVPPLMAEASTTALLLAVCKHATALHTGLDFNSTDGYFDEQEFEKSPMLNTLGGIGYFRIFRKSAHNVEMFRCALRMFDNHSQGYAERGLFLYAFTNQPAQEIAAALVAAAYNAGLLKASAEAVEAKAEAILAAQKTALAPLVHAAVSGTRTAVNNLYRQVLDSGLDVNNTTSPATARVLKLMNRLGRIVDALELAHNKLEGDKP
jgi:hypothetical protein